MSLCSASRREPAPASSTCASTARLAGLTAHRHAVNAPSNWRARLLSSSAGRQKDKRTKSRMAYRSRPRSTNISWNQVSQRFFYSRLASL